MLSYDWESKCYFKKNFIQEWGMRKMSFSCLKREKIMKRERERKINFTFLVNTLKFPKNNTQVYSHMITQK